MSVSMQLVACFVATVFFGFLLNQPIKTMVFSGLIATLGYGLYLALGQTTVAYFIATLLIAVLCEIVARILKKTATLFLTSALIPIVPGIGLYRTMRYLVEDQYDQAVKVGSQTLFAICAIALAVTVAAIFFANIRKKSR